MNIDIQITTQNNFIITRNIRQMSSKPTKKLFIVREGDMYKQIILYDFRL